MLLEINIRSKEKAPKARDAYDDWLGQAHDTAERWFLTLCRGTLFEEFGGKE